ncbi:hypothetical protein HYC85_019133 [Camellia sinensis]|uniref:Uncharacterized protein n=1 Tax=Camellia sinensis TaxID=4442 RepID=A0A7J7GNL0_CAMSI|nr:hypothetical protein HYC85_019133 [Camellia sinensis]
MLPRTPISSRNTAVLTLRCLDSAAITPCLTFWNTKMYFKHSSGDITDAPTTNLCNSFRYLGSGNWGNKSTAIGNVETTFSWFSVEFVSSSDITALAKDKIYTHINLEEMTINQALQLGQEPYSPYGSNSQRCHMCLRSDPLHKGLDGLLLWRLSPMTSDHHRLGFIDNHRQLTPYFILIDRKGNENRVPRVC